VESLNIPWIDAIVAGQNTTIKKPPQKWLFGLVVLPLFMATLLFLYYRGHLDGLFIKPMSMSSHGTIQEVRDNNNTIEVVFEMPVTEFSSVYTSGFDVSAITYSDDKKTLYLTFPDGINHPFNAILRSAYSIDGRIVKDVVIEVKE
jgi:hypothetical protein